MQNNYVLKNKFRYNCIEHYWKCSFFSSKHFIEAPDNFQFENIKSKPFCKLCTETLSVGN